jgi:hypothetical protein
MTGDDVVVGGIRDRCEGNKIYVFTDSDSYSDYVTPSKEARTKQLPGSRALEIDVITINRPREISKW